MESISTRRLTKILASSTAVRIKPYSGNVWNKGKTGWYMMRDIAVKPSGHIYLDIKYTNVLRPNQVRKARIRKSKLIWVRQNGLYPTGFSVGHRDGDRTNCSIQNLFLYPTFNFLEINEVLYAKVYPVAPGFIEYFDQFQLNQKEWMELLPEEKWDYPTIKPKDIRPYFWEKPKYVPDF